jgi:hypothetical protein
VSAYSDAPGRKLSPGPRSPRSSKRRSGTEPKLNSSGTFGLVRISERPAYRPSSGKPNALWGSTRSTPRASSNAPITHSSTRERVRAIVEAIQS